MVQNGFFLIKKGIFLLLQTFQQSTKMQTSVKNN